MSSVKRVISHLLTDGFGSTGMTAVLPHANVAPRNFGQATLGSADRNDALMIERRATVNGKRAARRPAKIDAEPSRPKLPMSQVVYQTLRRMLMTGRFRPGESVSLRTLAKRLGTSAMPVREAIHRLIAEQALQLLPNRQIIVPRMTLRKFEELSRVRQMLEGLAARAAARNINDVHIAELEKLNESLVKAIQADDAGLTLERNKDFHFALYESARTEILLPMIEGLWMQAGPFLYLSLTEQKWSWTNTQHVAVLEALRDRDTDAVVKAVQLDIRITANLLMEKAAFDP